MGDFLYRGVSKEMHLENKGLLPKGEVFSHELQMGEEIAQMGSGVVFGNSAVNAVVGHQYNSSKYLTSGISTTPCFEIAKEYALFLSEEGYVYKINRSILKTYNIEEFVVSQFVPFPNKPEDNEVILRNENNEKIDENVVVELIVVSKTK